MATKTAIRTKDTYHHGDLGKVLVDAVRRLIERDGPSNFSISEACKMAGVSTAAPYKHFKDKQDILRQVAKSGFADLTAAMDKGRKDRSKGQANVISEMGKGYVRFALENPGTFRLMFGSSPNVKDDPAVDDKGHDCFNTLIGEVADYLGPSADTDRAYQLAILLWTFVHGAASLAIDKDYESARIPVNVDEMVEFASSQLLARGKEQPVFQ